MYKIQEIIIFAYILMRLQSAAGAGVDHVFRIEFRERIQHAVAW